MSEVNGVPVEQPDPATRQSGSVDCAYVRDLSAPFALAAVEPFERSAIAEHLLDCPACSRLIGQLQQTATMLAFSVRQATPAVTAKAALFTRIAHASQQLPGTTAMTLEELEQYRSITIPASAEAFAMPAAKAVVPPKSARRSLSAWAMPLAMVPLLLALGIVGYWGVDNRSSLSDRNSQVNALTSQVGSLTQQVASYSSSIASMDKYFRNQTAEVYKLTPIGSAASSGAGGMLLAPPLSDEAMLLVYGLGKQSSQYEVMLQLSSGQLESGGTFTVNDEGNATTFITLENAISEYTSVFVQPVLADSTDSPSVAQPEILSVQLGNSFGQDGDTKLNNP